MEHFRDLVAEQILLRPAETLDVDVLDHHLPVQQIHSGYFDIME